MDKPRRKYIDVLVTVAALVLIALCGLPGWNNKYVKPYLTPLDDQAQSYLNTTLGKAIASYGTSRAINAVVSVIQNSEVTISVGAGASVALGEVLDPLNDIIERFSVVMLYSTVSLSIMQVLLKLGHWIGISLLLPTALALILISIWGPKNFVFPKKWGVRLLLIALMVRLFIPATMYANQKVHDLFLEETYLASTIELSEEMQPIEIDTSTSKGDMSWWDKLKAFAANGAGATAKIGTQLSELKKLSKHIVRKTISLTMVFLMQTAVIPIIALYLFYKLTASVAGAPFASAAKDHVDRGVQMVQEATQAKAPKKKKVPGPPPDKNSLEPFTFSD